MLSNQLMAIVSLAILWINTLLIAAAALKEAGALLRRRAALRPLPASGEGCGLARARALRGSAGGPLVVQRIEQRGRAGPPTRGRPVILFADRRARGECLGGALALEGSEGEIVLPPGAPVEIWLDADELARAAACPSDDDFDAALEQATKARGFLRTVDAAIVPGQALFIHGELRRSGAERIFGPGPAGIVLLATHDPRARLLGLAARLAAFALAALAACAGTTALALHEPHFEGLSKAGAFLCALFFVVVQPLGVALRDTCRVPSRAFLRGRWVRSAPLSAEASPTGGSRHVGAAAR
jgi:hypothetical protein